MGLGEFWRKNASQPNSEETMKRRKMKKIFFPCEASTMRRSANAVEMIKPSKEPSTKFQRSSWAGGDNVESSR